MSTYDWKEDELVPLDQLPRALNPKKGFLSNANNRQAPEHAINDYGATHMSTGRSVRIDELIREGIKDGKKFTPEDMIAYQQDSVDVFARNMLPNVVQLCETTQRDLTKDQQEDLHVALSYYRNWDGDMTEDSVAASIHMHYFLNFFKSLFHK